MNVLKDDSKQIEVEMFPLQKEITRNKEIDLLIAGESLTLLFTEF